MSSGSRDCQEQDSPLEHSITSAQHGSYAALGQLFDLYRDYLLRVANEELQANLAAKIAPSDLVQETFLQAVRDFNRFRGNTEGELKAWLRKILIHNLLDARRHYLSTQKRDISLEGPLVAHGSGVIAQRPLASSIATPSQVAISAEMRAAVQTALGQLPADYAQVIELRTFSGMKFEQVGSILGRSEDAARKMWVRAIERLAIELASYDSAR